VSAEMRWLWPYYALAAVGGTQRGLRLDIQLTGGDGKATAMAPRRLE
jgi:hypothetical protein